MDVESKAFPISASPINPQTVVEFLLSKTHQHLASQPKVASFYEQFRELYLNKYWHQLTEKIQAFVHLEEVGNELVELYNSFIREFEKKINPLSLSQITVKISRQFKDPSIGIVFLEAIAEKQKANKEATITLMTEIALLQLGKKEFEKSKKLIEEAKSSLQSMAGVDQETFSSLYFTASEFHRQRGTPAEFYTNGLLYLAYTPLEKIPTERKKALAFDLSLAALVGENIYNFGELITHPILDSVKGTSFEWITEFIDAFNHGNIAKYEQLVVKYEVVLLSQPALVAKQQTLKEKISILALMELVVGRDRVVSFGAISNAVKLPLDQVELLVMKALSLGLLKGRIDEVDQTVNFTWVQPRVLTTTQIEGMKERLGKWIETVHSTHLYVEGETPELVA